MDASAVDALLAQLSSAEGGSSAGLSSDALTQAILERLNEEVAKVYSEGSNNLGSSAGARGSPGHTSLSGSAFGRSRPAPVELWKAAHEGGKDVKPVRLNYETI